jgi:hypothetical protein
MPNRQDGAFSVFSMSEVLMEMGWILGGLFVFVTMIFLVVAVFLPEWVGITGKKAQQTMKEQQGDQPAEENQTLSDKVNPE